LGIGPLGGRVTGKRVFLLNWGVHFTKAPIWGVRQRRPGWNEAQKKGDAGGVVLCGTFPVNKLSGPGLAKGKKIKPRSHHARKAETKKKKQE